MNLEQEIKQKAFRSEQSKLIVNLIYTYNQLKSRIATVHSSNPTFQLIVRINEVHNELRLFTTKRFLLNFLFEIHEDLTQKGSRCSNIDNEKRNHC